MHNMIDSVSEISYKIHLIIGFGTGVLSSFLSNNFNDFLATFSLGAMGALGAGLMKLFTDWLTKKQKQKHIRDIVKEQVKEELKEYEEDESV